MRTPLDDFGFALWLTLEARCERRLQPIMAALAQRFAGPVFVPHMTLRARIPTPEAGEALLHELAQRCARFSLSFTQLRAGEQPFEALALLPETRGVDWLCALLTAAGSDAHTHVPHVSLYYGHAASNHVLAEATRHVHPPLQLHFAWLELWRICGDVPVWERLQRLRLAAHPRPRLQEPSR
jgi:hypothetical protein